MGGEDKRRIIEGMIGIAGRGIKEKSMFKMLLEDFGGVCRKEQGTEVLERYG